MPRSATADAAILFAVMARYALLARRIDQLSRDPGNEQVAVA
jgi:hypothetical protein